MKKVKIIYIPVLLSIACVVGIYIGAMFNVSSPLSSVKLYKQKQKLNTLLQLIENNYVDQVNTDSIVDITIANIIKDLDPHTAYLPKAELDAENQSMNGSFVGIGISYYHHNDTLTVVRTLPSGPSEKAGIKAGDKVIYIDDNHLHSKTVNHDSIISLLKGEEDTTVDIKIKRNGIKQLLDFKIKRQPVPIHSVDAGFMIDSETGYIKINRFSKTTFDEFMVFAKQLKSKKAKHVILDLRNNGGGYLNEATDIADQFLKDNTTIVFTKDRSGNKNITKATSNGFFKEVKVSILINERTASASEVIAGAIQDNDRGPIYGRRSFGKGLVQRVIPLGDESAVRLTVARYYTPTGRSIQRSYDDGRQEYFNEYKNRYSKGELESADSIQVIDSLAFKTPQGKIVYGGGGIIPDVFVPKNVYNINIALLDYFESGILDRFIFDELEKNRSFYNSLNKEDFMKYYEVEDFILKDFNKFLKDHSLQSRFYSINDETKKTYLKATIARQLFDTSTAYKLIAEKDEFILKVMAGKTTNN